MKYAIATDSMMMPSRAMNAATAKNATPIPPAWTLTLSSDLASSISLVTSDEMSRLASATSRPMVGSSGLGLSLTCADPTQAHGAQAGSSRW